MLGGKGLVACFHSAESDPPDMQDCSSRLDFFFAISKSSSPHPSFKGFIRPIEWKHILVKNGKVGRIQEFQQLKLFLLDFIDQASPRGSLASTL